MNNLFYRNIKKKDVKLTFFTRHLIYQIDRNNVVYRTDVSIISDKELMKLHGLKHAYQNKYILVSELTEKRVRDMEFFFKNGNPIYQLVFKRGNKNIIWNESNDVYCHGILFNFMEDK